jgi:hypothetical protein
MKNIICSNSQNRFEDYRLQIRRLILESSNLSIFKSKGWEFGIRFNPAASGQTLTIIRFQDSKIPRLNQSSNLPIFQFSNRGWQGGFDDASTGSSKRFEDYRLQIRRLEDNYSLSIFQSCNFRIFQSTCCKNLAKLNDSKNIDYRKCLCEERSDEAISISITHEIATPSARNDTSCHHRIFESNLGGKNE